MSSPSPREPPVTSAVRPSRSMARRARRASAASAAPTMHSAGDEQRIFSSHAAGVSKPRTRAESSGRRRFVEPARRPGRFYKGTAYNAAHEQSDSVAFGAVAVAVVLAVGAAGRGGAGRAPRRASRRS